MRNPKRVGGCLLGLVMLVTAGATSRSNDEPGSDTALVNRCEVQIRRIRMAQGKPTEILSTIEMAATFGTPFSCDAVIGKDHLHLSGKIRESGNGAYRADIDFSQASGGDLYSVKTYIVIQIGGSKEIALGGSRDRHGGMAVVMTVKKL